MSPAAAASAAVAARACAASCSTRSVRVWGPRLLLSTTSWPASTASRATVLPMCPLPMSPMVVMSAASHGAGAAFPERHDAPDLRGDRERADEGLAGHRVGYAARRVTAVIPLTV